MRNVFLIIIGLMLVLCTGCRTGKEPSDTSDFLYKHPEFNCPYTEEENIRNIKTRTEEIFRQELNTGLIVDYTVDILYAFDDDPEYFLIELTYKEGYLGNAQKTYAHCIGYIQNKEYYVGLTCYEFDYAPIQSMSEVFRDGKSGYALYASPEEKRYYYNGLQAVKRSGEIVGVEDFWCNESTHEHNNDSYCRVGKIIPKEKYTSYLILGREQPSIMYAKESVG